MMEWIKEEEVVENPWFNETFYLRFCRARKFDIVKIKEMFLKYIEYRKEHDLDNVIYVRTKYQSTQFQIRDAHSNKLFIWTLVIF